MDDRVAAASGAVARQAGAALTLLGGTASVFYVGGLVNQIAYFAALGAPWLVREIGITDIVQGCGASFAAAVTLPLSLRALSSDRVTLSPRSTRWVATIIAFVGLSVLFLDRLVEETLTIGSRSTLLGVGAVLSSVAAAFFFELCLMYRFEKRPRAHLKSLVSGLAVASLIFIVVAGLAGRALALYHGANPSKRLPVAVWRVGGSTKTMPVVFVGPNRIFCMDSSKSRATSFLPVEWSNVEAISDRRR